MVLGGGKSWNDRGGLGFGGRGLDWVSRSIVVASLRIWHYPVGVTGPAIRIILLAILLNHIFINLLHVFRRNALPVPFLNKIFLDRGQNIIMILSQLINSELILANLNILMDHMVETFQGCNS